MRMYIGMEGEVMTRFKHLALVCALVAVVALGFAPTGASAQMVPDTVDPYELAPQNVHLYPVTLNARIPYYYLPPIFAPTPMWRGALTADLVSQFAPHNYVVYEIPESTALVAWGTVKGDEQVTLEAVNQQEFLVLPPETVRADPSDPLASSYTLVRTEMRFVPRCTGEQLEELMDRELMLKPTRVNSIADQLPLDVLLNNYDRVADVANIDPQVHEFLQDEIANNAWPLDDIYINYSGWRRNPNRIRTLGHFVPEWFTIEGKLLARKRWEGGDYLITVEFEGYQPWYPIEFPKNVMRELIALSFGGYVETQPYYDVELPLNGKEWHRQGSPVLDPNTRQRAGTGSAGQGGY